MKHAYAQAQAIIRLRAANGPGAPCIGEHTPGAVLPYEPMHRHRHRRAYGEHIAA